MAATQALQVLCEKLGENVSYDMPGTEAPFQATATVGKQKFTTKRKFLSKKLAKTAAAELAVKALKMKKGQKKAATAPAAAKKKAEKPKTEEQKQRELDLEMRTYFDTPETIAARKAEREAKQAELKAKREEERAARSSS